MALLPATSRTGIALDLSRILASLAVEHISVA